jgi:hypothetical protein
MPQYIDEFLSLRCSGDVLSIVSPLGKKSSKEITESIGMIKRIRQVILAKPLEYNILDLCAGNALTSILAAFILPITYACAVDIKPRKRTWGNTKRFVYINQDIYDDSILNLTNENTILISVHACEKLAERIIDIYLRSKAKHLYLMPCCVNTNYKTTFGVPDSLRKKFGNYNLWSLYLTNKAKGRFILDTKILSPCNAIVIAKK